MKFTKVQSVGNDFVLIEANSFNKNWAELARAICQYHFGVGADGLLLLMPSKSADVKMVVFNSDGSEAEACGNGLRCLVYYAVRRGLIAQNRDSLKVETAVGIRSVKLERHGRDISKITCSMGKPAFAASDIPVDINLENVFDIKMITNYEMPIANTNLSLSFISMGNPHAIAYTHTSVKSFPLEKVGPLVENNVIFPKRTNFEIVRVINRKEIEMRVWERGVGETLACGSGACAVAVASQMLGYSDEEVSINLPGGILEVSWNREGEVLLGGKAEIVFEGEWQE